MAISYGPLRERMKETGVTWYQLANRGIDHQTLQRLRHDRLCQILDCQPGDLLCHRSE